MAEMPVAKITIQTNTADQAAHERLAKIRNILSCDSGHEVQSVRDLIARANYYHDRNAEYRDTLIEVREALEAALDTLGEVV